MSVRNVQKRHKWALDFTKYVCGLTVILLLLERSITCAFLLLV